MPRPNVYACVHGAGGGFVSRARRPNISRAHCALGYWELPNEARVASWCLVDRCRPSLAIFGHRHRRSGEASARRRQQHAKSIGRMPVCCQKIVVAFCCCAAVWTAAVGAALIRFLAAWRGSKTHGFGEAWHRPRRLVNGKLHARRARCRCLVSMRAFFQCGWHGSGGAFVLGLE